MSSVVVPKYIQESAPRSRARLAGVFYLLTFVTGVFSFSVRNKAGFVAGLIAAVCYIVVTLLFYSIFKPVNRRLSLLAALISLLGCVIGPIGLFIRALSHINPLVFFGFYCLLIGYLIFQSAFLPRTLGVLMAFAGVGWLTFLSPSLASSLNPYNIVPGFIGEGALTLWLLAKGVDEERWREQAGLIGRSA